MTRRTKNLLITSVVAAALTVIAVFSTTLSLALQTSDLRHDNKKLAAELTATRTQMDALKKGSDDSAISTQVKDLEAKLKAQDTRFTKSDDTIKALTQLVNGLGLCIDSDSDIGTYYINSIDTPAIQGGTKMCQTGVFTSVVPNPNPEGYVP